MGSVYLMLQMQFFENKVAVELTRSEFVEVEEVGIMPPLLPCLITFLFFFGNFSFFFGWGVGVLEGNDLAVFIYISVNFWSFVQMQIYPAKQHFDAMGKMGMLTMWNHILKY
jgi:hypothetical protein